MREGWYNEVYKETTFLSKRNQTSPPFFLCIHLHALCVSLMSSQDSHSPINITQLARVYRHFKAHVSEQEFMKVAGLTHVRSQIVSAAVCFSTCVALATPPASWDRRISLCLSHVLKCVFENLPLLLFYRLGFCGGEVGITALSNSNWQQKPKSL